MHEITSNLHDETVVRFVDQLIQDAILKKISDIHIEPFVNQYRIRMRQNGLLYVEENIASDFGLRIVMRIKIMANLNIAERRLPQDGHITLRYPLSNFSAKNTHLIQESNVGIRVNSCPTLHGEKIALRLLNLYQTLLNIDSLGFTDTQKQIVFNQLNKPQGLILVTGPTGSGKTITLYAALQYLNQPEKNIFTAEDPVEIELDGINQVTINTKIGLHFSDVLRTFLRQDPDIIMIGEIRDLETANIAIQAAQTGHLVLSTLHTQNAALTIYRLLSLGVTMHHLMTSISLIISQRLVRILCSHCKKPNQSTSDLSVMGNAPTYNAIGCTECHKGYQGRIGIFEAIPFDEKIKQLFMKKKSLSMIINYFKKSGHSLLWDVGLKKIQQGITSMDEITRVI